MKDTFQFLGTGASAGVPVIGCKCAVCASSSPLNQRLRSAGLLCVGGRSLLIDVGPDFRQQALKFGIDHLDGLLLTHAHYDHIGGLDELRVFSFWQKRVFPILLSQESLQNIQERYTHLFEPPLAEQMGFEALKGEMGQEEFLGVPLSHCTYIQNGMKVTGWRHNQFAYISDIKEYEDSIFPFLAGTDTLVLSALKQEKSPFHLSLDEAIAFSRRVGARKTYLTHLSHAVDHEALSRLLPEGVELGYDGLKITL